jgi:hypothetical protein
MSLFDTIYNKYDRLIKEETRYIDSTFEDNINLLVKLLVDNDYLKLTEPETEFTKQIMAQPKHTKEITLDTEDDMLPPAKLLLKQDSDSESFSVTVVNVKDPKTQKEFKNTMLETIFDDVVEYIKQMTLQGLDTAKQAVDELPSEEGANAQPGSGESALPGVGAEPDSGAEAPEGKAPSV